MQNPSQTFLAASDKPTQDIGLGWVDEAKGAKRDIWSHPNPGPGGSGVHKGTLTQPGLGLNFSSITI